MMSPMLRMMRNIIHLVSRMWTDGPGHQRGSRAGAGESLARRVGSNGDVRLLHVLFSQQSRAGRNTDRARRLARVLRDLARISDSFATCAKYIHIIAAMEISPSESGRHTAQLP